MLSPIHIWLCLELSCDILLLHRKFSYMYRLQLPDPSWIVLWHNIMLKYMYFWLPQICCFMYVRCACTCTCTCTYYALTNNKRLYNNWKLHVYCDINIHGNNSDAYMDVEVWDNACPLLPNTNPAYLCTKIPYQVIAYSATEKESKTFLFSFFKQNFGPQTTQVMIF